MKPSENKVNDFFLKRAGLGHLTNTGVRMNSIEDIALEYRKMSELSPRATTFIAGMAKLGKMAQTDAETFEEVTKKIPGVEFEHVAKIPVDLWNLILQQDPDILQDEKRFEKFLASDAAEYIRTPKHLRRGKKNVTLHLGK